MDKCIKVKPIKNFVKELEDPRLIHDALKEQELAISRLHLIQQEREKMDADMVKLNVDMEEFKKFVHEKSYQMEDYIDTIDEFENIIREEKHKQKAYAENIKSIDIDANKFDQIVQNAKSRITSYKPYEEFISKIIAKNHRYEDVFDIIKHVEELACIRNIGPSLQITEFNDKDSTNNDNTKDAPIIQFKKPKKNKIILKIDFNEARTYLDDLKKADLMYIKRKEKIKTDNPTKINLNPINQTYLKTDLDKLKDKQRFAQMENFQTRIQERENENNFVISSILHHYREFYLKNEGKLPTKFPLAEEQLAYVFDYYKKLVKRLEIYETLNSGKKTMKDYVSETNI